MLTNASIIKQARMMTPDARTAQSAKCEVILRYPFTIYTPAATILFTDIMVTFTRAKNSDNNMQWVPVCIRVCETNNDMHYTPARHTADNVLLVTAH